MELDNKLPIELKFLFNFCTGESHGYSGWKIKVCLEKSLHFEGRGSQARGLQVPDGKSCPEDMVDHPWSFVSMK